MKSGSVLLTLMVLLITSLPFSAIALQDDPVVIRGPVGSEQTDVRQGQDLYGPITRADTLWSIANRVRPHSSVTIPQVMSAIVQANPHAFLENNPNAMETGFMLRIPSLQEIQMINPQAAQRHIELGEQLQQSTRRLQTTQTATEDVDAQRVALLARTRDEAQSTLQQVRDEYSEEFAELRERMRNSVENTESAIAANQELRERLDSLSQAIDEIQRTMVAESEFQRQVRELMDEQQTLRLEQQAAREVEQEQGFANRIMANPLALILLAFLPALILIVIATLVLRRRDHQAVTPPVGVVGGASEVENVTAAGMVEPSEDSKDDFELDEAMAEFDDLDDDEDGDDLSALEDEMLVPDEDEDDSIQLDDDMDDLDLSEFDALETDSDSDSESFIADKDEPDSENAEPAEGDDAGLAQADSDESSEDDNSALSQSDLDDLFAGGFGNDDDDELEDIAGNGLTQPVDETAEDVPSEDEEPSPAELFASDDDEDSLEDEGDELTVGAEASADEFGILESDEDDDFEKMMEKFAEDDLDDTLDDDDIDALLAKSDALINESEAEQIADVEPATVDEDDEIVEDADEAVALEAEETLDFTDPEDAETDEAEVDANKAETAATDGSFIDIDDILDEAQEEHEEDDDPQSSESRRADEEDNLAAQLDLARAYLEMDEKEEARETIESVINQASGDLLTEAKELLTRLDG